MKALSANDRWKGSAKVGALKLRFQVVTALSLKMAVFWDVAPCSLVEIDQRFRDAFLNRHSVSTRLHGTASQKTDSHFLS
jgi:hypothetical protein